MASPAARETSNADGAFEKETGEHVEEVDILAVAESERTNETMWHAIRSNPKVIFYAALVNIGPILYGYDVIVGGAIVALPGFLTVYGENAGYYWALPVKWQSLWTAFVQIGIMLGAMTSGAIQDRFGRKAAFFVGGLLSAMGVGIAFGSGYPSSMLGRRLTFFFAKFGLGTGMGALVGACQTYISEIAPPRIRGPLLGLFPFMSTVGQMIAISIIFKRVAIMDKSSFEIPFATQWIFSGLAMVVAFVIPESPVYLVSKSRINDAEKSYRKLHSATADARAAVGILAATYEHEQQVSHLHKGATYADCFKGTDLRRTIIILIVNAIPQFFGIALIANGTYFMEIVGMSAHSSFQLGQIGVGLMMAAAVISWFTMTTFGRRPIILYGSIATCLMYVGMGAGGCFKASHEIVWVVGSMLVLVCFTFGLGLGSVYYVVAAEMSSIKLRAKSSGLGFFMNAISAWVFAYVTPYFFNPDAGALGGKTGFIFAGFCFLAFVISFFVIPETRGRSFAELDHLFETRTKTRAFAKTVVVEDVENSREEIKR